mmetsp:Transcript_42373/g.76922  ORF Transcript_42373/g.76922 Transcript_42373/m.76922 type:complete len:215 (-) Transcript_42373:13-657(-)
MAEDSDSDVELPLQQYAIQLQTEYKLPRPGPHTDKKMPLEGLQDLFSVLDHQREQKENDRLQALQSRWNAEALVPKDSVARHKRSALQEYMMQQSSASRSRVESKDAGRPAWGYGPAPGYLQTPVLDTCPALSEQDSEGSYRASYRTGHEAWRPCPKPGKSRVQPTGLFGPAPPAPQPFSGHRGSMRPPPLLMSGNRPNATPLHSAAQLTLLGH